MQQAVWDYHRGVLNNEYDLDVDDGGERDSLVLALSCSSSLSGGCETGAGVKRSKKKM